VPVPVVSVVPREVVEQERQNLLEIRNVSAIWVVMTANLGRLVNLFWRFSPLTCLWRAIPWQIRPAALALTGKFCVNGADFMRRAVENGIIG
jgi:hypothetical protein